jgi:N-acyl-D-aspartate/D-glutamate deacylase
VSDQSAPSEQSDLLIRGGRVVDGTGMAGYTADVEVRDGRISRIGRFPDATAREVVDADGLTVTPGFVDIHTHYDAQAHFEPTLSPSSWHGVTTVMMGNCGFSLAPAPPADLAWLCSMLSRVEGMEAAALEKGVDFPGGDFDAFLSGLEGRVGLNIAGYVGHCAVRRVVMGDAASERAATADEIAAMAELVRASLRAGAIGFSTSQLDIHADHEGRPVPCNLAAPDEMIALAAVLGEFDHGVIEFLPRSGSDGYDDGDRALILAMSTASGCKPMNVNPLTRFPAKPEAWRDSMAFVEQAQRDGHRIHPMFMINVKGIHFSLDSTFVLDEMPTFRSTLTLPMAERAVALADPAVRERLKAEFADPTGRALIFGWDEVKVASVNDPSLADAVGLTVAELGARSGVDPLDALLDLALADRLEAVFVWQRRPDPAIWDTTVELVRHPLTMAGSSDGGAHLLTFCGADYTTRVLTDAVPDVLSFEQAIARLTMQPALLHGLWDRGTIRPGNVADLLVLDPDGLGVEPIALKRDFPADAARLVFGARGYHRSIVGGQVVLRDGVHTGALPGEVIRAGR